MTANPDLADLIITYLKEFWPKATYLKIICGDWGSDVFAISINDHNIGIVSGSNFATWDFTRKHANIIASTDKNFFHHVKYWAELKAGLSNPV